MKQENQARSSRICSVCAKSQRPTISSVGGGGDGDESKVFLLILFGKSTQSTGCCVSGRRCWAPIPTIHLFNDTYPKSVLIRFGAKLSLQLDSCCVVSFPPRSMGSQSVYLPSVIWRWCHVKVSNGHSSSKRSQSFAHLSFLRVYLLPPIY